MRQPRNTLLALTATLTLASAGATPGVQVGTDGGYLNPLQSADNVLGAVTGGFSSLDNTISMLSKAIDLASAIPVIGAYAQMLKPILNTYLDLRQSIQPMIDAANRGRTWVKEITRAKEIVKRLFQSPNLPDALTNVNDVIARFGGMKNLPSSARKINPNDVRKSMQPILAEADRVIRAVRGQKEAAKASGNVTAYRYYAQREDELSRLRARLRQQGEAAAAQADSRAIVSRVMENAERVANSTQGLTTQLRNAESEVGSIKALGAINLEQMNTLASGIDAMSQHLAVISQQQTISNEQTEQLLGYFEADRREAVSRYKLLLDRQEAEQIAELKRVQAKSAAMGDFISQTLQPNVQRKSGAAQLMKGVP